ncbi:MAG: hypothetical protein HN929_10080 [Chloroflexi bacterium]|jgi:hypothetical protein|nr:hypothetical protein [Chloroflexota bacterium]MBT7081798.1 hypothetical protein [Chloroflexota bacterium]MBT7290102.1 hypothetical protein [Chloroflexota bacterium]
MSLFDLFRRKRDPNKPSIKFGFKGEQIEYRLRDKSIVIGFAYRDGAKLYTEDIKKWDEDIAGQAYNLSHGEKTQVFSDVLDFVCTKRNQPTVVINKDDADKTIWEKICSNYTGRIKDIEYTSDQQNIEAIKQEWMDALAAGEKVIVDDIEIENGKDIDAIIEKMKSIKGLS